jgi:hypothetical protein
VQSIDELTIEEMINFVDYLLDKLLSKHTEKADDGDYYFISPEIEENDMNLIFITKTKIHRHRLSIEPWNIKQSELIEFLEQYPWIFECQYSEDGMLFCYDNTCELIENFLGILFVSYEDNEDEVFIVKDIEEIKKISNDFNYFANN